MRKIPQVFKQKELFEICVCGHSPQIHLQDNSSNHCLLCDCIQLTIP